MNSLLLLLCILFLTASVSGGGGYIHLENFTDFVDASSDVALKSLCYRRDRMWEKTMERIIEHCGHEQSSECCLMVGYCMTYYPSSQSVLLGKCPYFPPNKTIEDRVYMELDTTYSTLNQFMCGGSLEREGRLCGKCKKGYGPAVLSQDVTCYHCAGRYHGWALYLFIELFSVTVFFLIVVFLHISATSASMNAFVFFCQMIVALMSYRSPVFEAVLGQASMVLVKFLMTVYGFWNLDFFRELLPPFCVSDKINNMDALALQYIAAFYPLFLILVTYACIELHGRNFRVFVCLWSPFHRCYAHCRRMWNSHSSIVHVFATFLLLSYSKLIFVSANLMNFITTFNITGLSTTVNVTREVSKTFLYFEPSIETFSTAHLPYAIPAMAVFSTFILIPPVLLILYPTKIFQKCLGCCDQRWHALHTFVDAFQGCYKDGTNGTRDCRYFAGLYLLLRIVLFIMHTVTVPLGLGWIIPGVLFILFSWCFATFRPYKIRIFNIVDGTLMSGFGVASFLAAFTTYPEDPKFTEAIFIIIYSICCFPLLYIVLYSAFILFSKVKTQWTASYADVEVSYHATDDSIRANWQLFPDRVLNPNNYGTV